jgi:hypothetical protein
MFRDFTKYYDEEVFRGVTRSIRAKAYDCDDLLPTERIQAIAEIFTTFKNPDKETVLTPWNVVNMQISLTLGGSDFSTFIKEKPEWLTQGSATNIWAQDETKILEINSKSGLYPLLATYNIYTRQLIKHKKPEDKISKQLWSEVLRKNIYVLCKSPMAKIITIRTLAGYSGAKTNIVYIKDLVNKLREGDYDINSELQKEFGIKDKEMKFTAVVGNPPYQVTTETNFAAPVYHLFFEAAKSLSPDYISMIHPARFLFDAGATPKEWNKKMLNDPKLSIALYEPDSQKIFSGVDIKGGVCVTFWNTNLVDGGLNGVFIVHELLRSILEKTKPGGFDRIVGPRGETKLTISLDSKYPNDLRIAPNYFDRFKETFIKSSDSKHNIKIVGLEKGNRRTERFVDSNLIRDPKLNNWKVLLPKSNGAGLFGEIMSSPLIGEPLTGCTYSFLQIGAFDSRSETNNCIK